MSVDLTLVERAALIALMASGGSLRESADLRRRFGITLTPTHRAKLQELGLVTSAPGPLRYALTEAGWRWTREEIAAAGASPPPKGQMGLGALYALLAGVGRVLEREGGEPAVLFGEDTAAGLAPSQQARETAALEENAPPDTKPGTEKTESAATDTPTADEIMAENAWRLADAALARALQQTPRLRKALDGLDRDLKRFVGETIDGLRHAARTREMEIVGQPGDVAPFDAEAHEDDDQGFRSGERVRIVRPAVFQGSGSYRRVVRKAQVVGAE
jgi:hypothetical protein